MKILGIDPGFATIGFVELLTVLEWDQFVVCCLSKDDWNGLLWNDFDGFDSVEVKASKCLNFALEHPKCWLHEHCAHFVLLCDCFNHITD